MNTSTSVSIRATSSKRHRDLTCADEVDNRDRQRRGRVKSSMVVVPAIILFGLYCFALGHSLGKESCGQSKVDSKLRGSSYSYERISPEDWKAGNSLQRSISDKSSIVMIDVSQHSKEPEEQQPLSAGKSDDSEHSQSPEGRTPTKKGDESQHSGISDGSKLGRDELYQILPLPEEWENFSFVEIHQHFHCSAHARNQRKPLHSLEQWRYMREKYSEVVDENVTFDDPVPPTAGYTLRDGEPPPYYAKSSPGKGRGIFAARDISEGELVHDGDRSAVVFADAAAWRRYVFALPAAMACDIAEWSWTQRLTRPGRLRTLVDLNIAAFFNGGADKESNVMPRGSTGLKFFATRDIEKDSELLYDYDVYETNWKKVGLGRQRRKK